MTRLSVVVDGVTVELSPGTPPVRPHAGGRRSVWPYRLRAQLEHVPGQWCEWPEGNPRAVRAAAAAMPCAVELKHQRTPARRLWVRATPAEVAAPGPAEEAVADAEPPSDGCPCVRCHDGEPDQCLAARLGEPVPREKGPTGLELRSDGWPVPLVAPGRSGRLDCPVPECDEVGLRGMAAYRAHVRDTHPDLVPTRPDAHQETT